MPFSNNVKPDKMPGPINGNPMLGLCDRVCIQVKKVFDACVKQETITGQLLALTSTVPTDVVTPFTYISARNTTTKGEITNLIIIPGTERQGCSRVQCTVTIPMEVLFTDSTGITASGASSIVINKDVLLNIPQASIIPYEIEAVVSAVSTVGAYVSDATFAVTACVTVILKVVSEVELLVPSYGYCFIPPCQEFQQEVCEGFFDLPLFPRDRRC